jgi:hypothetical protein
VYSDATLPNLTEAMEQPDKPYIPTGARHPVWQSNQHNSPLVRPADVAVYVSSGTRAALDAVEVHLAVQETETLHALIFIGPVCTDNSQSRCVWARFP